MDEQLMTVSHRNALTIYHGKLAEVKKLEARKQEQESILQKQQAEKASSSDIRVTKNRINVLSSMIGREAGKLREWENQE